MRRLAILLTILAAVAALATLVQAYIGIWTGSWKWNDSSFLTFIVTALLGGAASVAWVQVTA